MFPPQILHNNGINTIYLMGNSSKPYYKKAIEYYFHGFSFISADFPSTAAYGAAFSVSKYCDNAQKTSM